MAGIFTIPKLTVRKETLRIDVPTFKWDEFTLKQDLGIGAFGSVYSGEYTKRDDPVTIKVLRIQDRDYFTI